MIELEQFSHKTDSTADAPMAVLAVILLTLNTIKQLPKFYKNHLTTVILTRFTLIFIYMLKGVLT